MKNVPIPIRASKVSSNNSSLLIYLPRTLIRILEIEKGDFLNVFADVENNRIILEKTGFRAPSIQK